MTIAAAVVKDEVILARRSEIGTGPRGSRTRVGSRSRIGLLKRVKAWIGGSSMRPR